MPALLRKTVWFGGLVAVVVVVAEAMSRLDDAMKSATPLLASPSHTDLTMQDSLGIRGRPFARFQKIQLNNAGFRGPEISLEPRLNCVRIAVMGSSETLGHSVSSGKEFPSQLSDLLNRNGCYEVMNAGIAGLPLAGQIALWDNWIARFQPSVVVIYASPGFYLRNEPPRLAVTTIPSRTAPASAGSVRASSRLLARMKDRIEYPAFIQRRRVMKIIAHATDGREEDWFFRSVPADRLALYREHLDTLIARVRTTGAVPVLVTHAMRFGSSLSSEERDVLRAWRQFTPRATEEVLLHFEVEAAAAVRDLARERGLPLADVAALMTGHPKWFSDFIHFNDEGGTVIARAVASTVKTVGRFPPAIELSAAN